jgi:SecD/SecF fusion protein
MNKPSIWKWLILIGLIAWSMAILIPVKENVNLGIDLVGGSSFLLEVQLDELDDDQKKDAPQRALEVIRNRVDGMGLAEPIIFLQPATQRIVVQLPGIEDDRRQEVREIIKQSAYLEFKLVHEESETQVQRLFASGEAPIGYKIVPIDDEQLLKRDEATIPEEMSDEEIFRARRTFMALPNSELMFMVAPRLNQTFYEPVYVERRRQLTGEHLKTAGVQQDFSKLVPTYLVTLEFNSEGKSRFGRLTADYAPFGDRNPNEEGRRLAIILDGTLHSAPVVREAIYGGNATITGNFTIKEASKLALVLRAGSLPAPVEIIEERTVDPTLGKDSIDSSIKAFAFGGIAVVVFVLLYYLLAGFIANLALTLDLVLLPLGMMVAAGFLGLFTGSGTWAGPIGLPTLTLAGIAGIVLTIGMAVDANVLIFERIREEQVSGKRFKSAVDAGYEKVFSTIFDANITTLLTAIILFWQGSGPIRGFAITLSAGIIVSMYVALVVTRMMFDLLGHYTNISQVKMMTLVKNTEFKFMDKRYIAAGVSLLLILSTWGIFISKGKDNFGVDFTGGSAISYQVKPGAKPDQKAIRVDLEQAGFTPQLQFQKELMGEGGADPDEFLEIKVPFEQGERLYDYMSEGKYDLSYSQTESVGPQVGKELRKKGILSILWALVGIVIYISVRFEFGFAMGAIVALVHDVLITVGLYCLFGRQLSLPIVAALLTIVGYSVNDTIVVFDRIREDLTLHKGQKYSDLADGSINRTLSRTVMTSVTTLLTVVMLLFFGGGEINDFALALFIGILVGTYSSIFVATPVTIFWHRDRQAGEKTTS